jgi:hypothetical protein
VIRKLIRNLLYRIADFHGERLRPIADERSLLLLGRLLANQARERAAPATLAEAEFRVFSQWGEDGILQYLVQRLPGLPRAFVEFGVQDYVESNTRFLLLNDNWSGLIIDGSAEDIRAIRASRFHWRHDLTAVAAFVTRDNINGLIAARFGEAGIGLLSIDLDGNDYWVWEAIACRPGVVACEYNSVFGGERAVTVPYREDFERGAAHSSMLYFGASLAALRLLARRKGYVFVGSNSAGNNAFFVRDDLAAPFSALAESAAYVESRFRESRDSSGAMTYLAGDERLRAIQDMPLVDVESGQAAPIRTLFAGRLA